VLNFQERQDLLESTENDFEMGDPDASNWIDEDDLDTTLAAPPPGEEGFFLSHEGGESSLQQIFVESMAERYELLRILQLFSTLTFFLGNVMISEHDKIESNVRCSSGAHSYPISWTHILHSQRTVPKKLNQKPLGPGISKSLTLNVSF
jgi:hypothetical protein